MQKLIVVVGPTASGKSDLGVCLAKKFNGEIVSADSRQVYKGLDIGSGKITKKEMTGIPHHLLDIASPTRKFSVAQYQKEALKAVHNIRKRGNLPILVGGTPFYVYSVVDGYVFPSVKPNQKLRATLVRLSNEELLERLQKLDPDRAKTIEQKNKRRLIRAIEIVTSTRKPVPKLKKTTPTFDTLFIGAKKSPDEIKLRIRARLLKRLRKGMVREVKNLHAAGLAWKRFEELGLEYRIVAQYIQGKIGRREMIDAIQKESEAFARRQMLWFKKDSRIHWVEKQEHAAFLVQRFLNSK